MRCDPTPPFKMRKETKMEQYRYATWQSKEPETISWLKSFDPHDSFYDVGACVGIYSLFCASLFPRMIIQAFEPMHKNFVELEANRDRNRFKNILCYPWAIGNYDGFCDLKIPDETAGTSGAQVRPGTKIPIARIDTILLRSIPANIKIDIDGQELEVVKGMQKTLPHIKSILIEVRPASKGPIVDILTAAGFTMDNRFNKMSPHSRERRAKEGIPDENIVFTR